MSEIKNNIEENKGMLFVNELISKIKKHNEDHKTKLTTDEKISNEILHYLPDNVTKAIKIIDTRYLRGKIYVLYYEDDPSIFYVGHSIKHYLEMKLSGHKEKSNTKGSLLYDTMREKGKDKWKIYLLENFPCKNKIEITIREQQIIDLLKPPLNTGTAFNPYKSYNRLGDYQNAEIYKITLKSDRTMFYIGSTARGSIYRFEQHKYYVNELSKNKLHKALFKYGVENFEMEVLLKYPCNSKIELVIKEQEYINTLKPTLNMFASSLVTYEKWLLMKEILSKADPMNLKVFCLCGIKIRNNCLRNHLDSKVHSDIMEMKKGTDTNFIKEIIDGEYIVCLCGYKTYKSAFSSHISSAFHKKLMESENMKKLLCYVDIDKTKKFREEFPFVEYINVDEIQCVCGIPLSMPKIVSMYIFHLTTPYHQQFMKIAKSLTDTIDITKDKPNFQLEYKIDEKHSNPKNRTILCTCGINIPINHYNKHKNMKTHVNLMNNKKTNELLAKFVDNNEIKSLRKEFPMHVTNDKSDLLCSCGISIKKGSANYADYTRHMKTTRHMKFTKSAQEILDKINNKK